MFPKEIIFAFSVLILLIAVLIENDNYQNNNYDVTGFRFVCNKTICEVRHLKQDNNKKYIDKIDISKIENFSYKLENVPRTERSGMVIYANRKDGTSFRFSPIYITPSRFVDSVFIKSLNRKIKEGASIDVSFPFRTD